MKNRFPIENIAIHENHKITYENHANHDNSRIAHENYEDHGNHIYFHARIIQILKNLRLTLDNQETS